MSETKVARKVNPDLVQIGDVMAIITFVRVNNSVIGTFGRGKLKVTNLDNQEEFEVIGRELIQDMSSADRYDSEKKVTRTEMAEILTKSWNRPFTATFTKADGKTKRTLRGRLVEPENGMGRSLVEDLDKALKDGNSTSRLSQVDHRTLESLIVNNIKYILKK